MLSGPTLSAAEIAGTAVLRIVVSNDSMKNATATSHGSNCLLVWDRAEACESAPAADAAATGKLVLPEGTLPVRFTNNIPYD